MNPRISTNSEDLPPDARDVIEAEFSGHDSRPSVARRASKPLDQGSSDGVEPHSPSESSFRVRLIGSLIGLLNKLIEKLDKYTKGIS